MLGVKFGRPIEDRLYFGLGLRYREEDKKLLYRRTINGMRDGFIVASGVLCIYVAVGIFLTYTNTL